MEYKSFEEKELKILRDAVDNATTIVGKKMVQSDDIKNIITILETFLRAKKTLCYGGTAINNILPEQYRFYNRNIEIPDYDFFTPYAIEYAKDLANIYYKEGYEEVEAKSGVHAGTYKVFVNFIPIADITFLEKNIFNNLRKKAVKINAINYCPPNYLRMAMYQELSRPMGDVTRWEKILKRLILLNKSYPLKGEVCYKQDFQRHYDGSVQERDKIYEITRNSFINQGLIFFGGYAASLYGKYMPKHERKVIDTVPDFDILSDDPYSSATILKEQLQHEGFNKVVIIKKKSIGEYVDDHYEINVNKDVIAFIYKSNACHSYNSININGQKVKIASIDTMLSFYLIFIYANRPYYDENRLLCMSEYLFKVQLKNRLQQKGLLRRFSVSCYGKQKTLEDMRAEKSKIYKQLKDRNLKRDSIEYNIHFFRYIPSQDLKKQTPCAKSQKKVKKGKIRKIKTRKHIKKRKMKPQKK
tara:strand:- start:399 stop:1811 length:1413 start_codon:yes stop_codon:yes gene_type:complete